MDRWNRKGVTLDMFDDRNDCHIYNATSSRIPTSPVTNPSETDL